MKNYRINFIDGHDLRYKSFETTAKSESAALDNLWGQYDNGDLGHQIVEIIMLDALSVSPPSIAIQAPQIRKPHNRTVIYYGSPTRMDHEKHNRSRVQFLLTCRFVKL